MVPPAMLRLTTIGSAMLRVRPGMIRLETLDRSRVIEDAIPIFGNYSINTYVILGIASWRHIGYIMLLYLAGLKSVDPSLREAAAIDGATEWQTFRKIVLPAMAPVNTIIIVITVIESLRAFDLIYIIYGTMRIFKR